MVASVSTDEVKHLAWLARIDLTERELEEYAKQVDSILGYLGTLDKLPEEKKIEPLRRSLPYADFRDDLAVECKDDVLGVVRNKKERFVKAPKMV